MKDSFLLIIQDEQSFLNLEFVFEKENKKKLYINGENVVLKDKEVDIFYLLAINFNEVVSKEAVIRVLLDKKDLKEELLDIDIKYSNNRVSEVIGKIEKLLCNLYQYEYKKNIFIQRKSKQGYLFTSNTEIFVGKNFIKKAFNANNPSEIQDFYYKYQNYAFIKKLKTFILFNTTSSHKEYLEEAPYIESFYGREEELKKVKAKLSKYNLLCIYGTSGIGKSFITRQVVNEIKFDYDIIIWKNLKNIVKLDNIIENLLYKLSEEKEIINNDNIIVNLNLLLHELQNKKILLILDNIENIFEENYKTFLTLLNSNNLTESKIILTCRERPDLFRLNTERSSSLKIEWLDYESCNKIVFKYGIFSEKELLRKFIYKLGGNPQLINMVSHTIKKVFLGNLSSFMNVNSNLTSDIYNFFDEQFENMSEIEKSILFTLNISKKGKYLEEIFEIISFINTIELTNTIEVLIDKAFIFTLDKFIHIESIVAEYFTKKINILVLNEILTNKPEILKKYFLVSANEDNEIFELQKTCFIKEIIRLLLNTLVSLENLASKIQEIILIRNTFTIEEQYILNANLIQLIINSDLKLKAFNFNLYG